MTPLDWIDRVIGHAEKIAGSRDTSDHDSRIDDLQGFIQGNPYPTANEVEDVDYELIALNAESLISQIRDNSDITAEGIMDIVTGEIAGPETATPEVKAAPIGEELSFSQQGNNAKHGGSRKSKKYCCRRAAEIWEKETTKIDIMY